MIEGDSGDMEYVPAIKPANQLYRWWRPSTDCIVNERGENEWQSENESEMKTVSQIKG